MADPLAQRALYFSAVTAGGRYTTAIAIASSSWLGSGPTLHRQGGKKRMELSRRFAVRRSGYLKPLTARAATRSTVSEETVDSESISIFAPRVSGIASVGEKAIEFVNET